MPDPTTNSVTDNNNAGIASQNLLNANRTCGAIGKLNFSKSVAITNNLVIIVAIAAFAAICATVIPMGLPWYQIILPVSIALGALMILSIFTSIIGLRPVIHRQKATINDVVNLA